MGDATATSATATATTAAAATTASSASYFSFQVGQLKPGAQMPFSSYYSAAQPYLAGAAAAEQTGEEHSAPAPALSADAYDCESEEGVEVLEEPVKPAPSRSSGSKRSRAAEVHNLSEKRRRSRINEKMKALQNLIPNSNKTDKASMLDEAIEYLKQLQLQVQMLSMRNGLNLHPMYFPGALQPLQTSQVPIGFGINNESAMNIGVGMLTLNQESSASSSFDPLNRCTSSHQSGVLPSLTNITNPESSFRIESSQSHSGSFQVTLPAEEIFTEELASQRQFDAGHNTRALQGESEKLMALTASMPFDMQESFLDADGLETCMLGRQRSQDMLQKDPDHQILVQHLHGLQAGRSFSSSDVKAEATNL